MANLYIINHPNRQPVYKNKSMGATNIIPWTVNIHTRKFIKRAGTFLNGTITVKSDLLFWGEYEPYSVGTIVSRKPILAIHDKLQHVASLPPMPINGNNTDPYVFDCFRNICCRRGNVKYKQGDIILFGTFISNTQFELDTVIVVRDLVPITTLTKTDNYYLASVLPYILAATKSGKTPHPTFVDGVCYSPSVKEYSYVPCLLPSDVSMAMSKPIIDVTTFGHAANKNCFGWVYKRVPISRTTWKDIKSMVEMQGWHIGIQLDKI